MSPAKWLARTVWEVISLRTIHEFILGWDLIRRPPSRLRSTGLAANCRSSTTQRLIESSHSRSLNDSPALVCFAGHARDVPARQRGPEGKAGGRFEDCDR